MSEKLFSLLSGIIFGVGLVISGMTNPEKVIGFLSITHNWDASLIFVMGGAILVFAPFFYLMKNKDTSSLGFKIIVRSLFRWQLLRPKPLLALLGRFLISAYANRYTKNRQA